MRIKEFTLELKLCSQTDFSRGTLTTLLSEICEAQKDKYDMVSL